MKKALNFIKNKVVFLVAVTMAAVVGGATTAVVLASIPDSNGVIHSCYKNSTGALSVIDNSTQSCSGNETALSWNQSGGGSGGPLAYAHVVYDETVSNQYRIDNDRSNNLTYVYSDTSTNETKGYICLKVENGNPKNITAIGGANSTANPLLAAVKDENGWSSDGETIYGISSIDFCEQNAPTANVALYISGASPDTGKTDSFITIF